MGRVNDPHSHSFRSTDDPTVFFVKDAAQYMIAYEYKIN
jgi:hypothetical protein